MKKTIGFILITALIGSTVLAPFSAYAATTDPPLPAAPTDSQAVSTGQTSTATTDATSAVGGALSCIAGDIVANLAQTIVSAITGLVTSKTTDTTRNVPKVPVAGAVEQDYLRMQTEAHTGTSIYGIFSTVSWDAIAFCIGNAIIQYLADSTTAWINSGFNGNPAFVSNPEQFFTDLADQEAGAFLQSIVGGTLGVDICQPFRVSIQTSALGNYNGSYSTRSVCTLSAATANLEGFLSGNSLDFNLGTFYSASQNPQNNYYEAQLMANNELRLRINTQLNLAQKMLDRNNGYLDVKDCPKDAAGNQIGDCKTTVPGSDTQKAGQDSRNLANLRLVAAEKFDQVISALVNQLIKIALNKLLTTN